MEKIGDIGEMRLNLQFFSCILRFEDFGFCAAFTNRKNTLTFDAVMVKNCHFHA
jgi:hypothetical protein